MIQCDKLLGLGLAERRDVLEKSGLCMFCLKHSAEFECYGRGGLSKPRCTRSGCDGEHTPNVHMLMGEDDAKVNFVAGSEGEEEYEAGDEHGVECEYEWEYEDGGLWVGTVGAVGMLEWGEEAPATTGTLASAPNGSRPGERGSSEQNKQESDFQVDGNPEEEAVGDGWWDLEMECPGLEDGVTETSQAGFPCLPPCEASWSGHLNAARGQGARKRQKTMVDQWEEARQSARLRQMFSSGLSSEDEDEEQHEKGAESGKWTPELYEPP
jgi:hypothetical protein